MIKILVALTLALLLAGCGNDRLKVLEGENDDLRSQISSLQEQLQTVKTAATDVEEKAEKIGGDSDDLQSQVTRLDDENWREIVPEIKSSSDEIDSAKDALKSSVSDLTDALDDN